MYCRPSVCLSENRGLCAVFYMGKFSASEGRYGKRCGGRCGKCCEGRCEGRCGAGREARFYTDILNPVILRIRDLDEILAEEA